MKNSGDKIKESLLKHEAALNRFRARKAAFFITKNQVIKDIEEARTIWEKTKEQLPPRPFEQ
jgi:hypothetical protein